MEKVEEKVEEKVGKMGEGEGGMGKRKHSGAWVEEIEARWAAEKV